MLLLGARAAPRVGAWRRTARRWCSGTEPVVKKADVKGAADATRAHDRFVRKVIRETKRLERGTVSSAIGGAEEVEYLNPKEYSEKMYAQQQKKAADERGNVLLSAYYGARNMLTGVWLQILGLVTLFVWIYGLVKCPMHGDSLPFLPNLVKAALWDGLWLGSREINTKFWDRLTVNAKKWFFPHLYNY
eukprot:TRINITY_DN1308_c0_g1_i1.p1 TRINITY_DN1308_c0_g1~~TRINITY_DN1308_c0_g1_i1.p1  ORF type:complete len:189 (+),score=26.90 TRINITY_DN1308_c0_g1_i1:75-641(+)